MVVYFELNNWFSERDYPDDEPFISWLSDDLHQKLQDNEWAKSNKICILAQMLDMSFNYLVTAPESWVKQNCPKLLTDYSCFIRHPEHSLKEDLPYGRTGECFLEWKRENWGVKWGPDL